MQHIQNFQIILENKHFTDLNPIVFGRANCTPNQLMNLAPDSRYYCLIHYVTSGKGKLNIYGNTYEVQKNQIFIIPDQIANSYQADDDTPWNYIWIGFTGTLSKYFSELPPVMDLHSNLFYEMLTVVDLEAMQEEFLVSKLFDLYRTLFADNTVPNYVNAVRNFIDCNYMYSDISINAIANSLNLNRSYLSRLFKEKVGMNIQQYIIHARMSHATSLLKSGVKVKDVALQVGYTDPYNFSKTFKKFYGFSPKDV